MSKHDIERVKIRETHHKCSHCNGNGFVANDEIIQCKKCNGTGEVIGGYIVNIEEKKHEYKSSK